MEESEHMASCDYSDTRGCNGHGIGLVTVDESLVCVECAALAEEDAEPKPVDFHDECGQ